MKIIGFSGKKQSGKTTAVNNLRQRTKGSALDFAGCLKELVFHYFAAPTEEYKDCVWEPFATEESKQAKHPCGKTYRELLQIIGTDMFRGLWPEIWIENYKFRASIIDELPIITADVRFPNEVKCIQDMGGHVIRLLRAPFPEDKHESETALDRTEYETQFRDSLIERKNYTKEYAEKQTAPIDIKTPIYFDAVIDNRKMTIEQQNEAVWKLVNEKGWI